MTIIKYYGKYIIVCAIHSQSVVQISSTTPTWEPVRSVGFQACPSSIEFEVLGEGPTFYVFNKPSR